MDSLFGASLRNLCCARGSGPAAAQQRVGPGRQLMNMLVEFKPELDSWIDEEISALFQAADGDGDKTLGKVEMKRLEQSILNRGFQFPIRLKNFDTTGSGDIDLKEFTAAIRMALRETDMSLLTLLKDKTRAQGLLEQACLITERWSQEELIPILLEIGAELGEDDDEGWSTPERAQEELDHHDANGDGLLDSQEFGRLFNILLGKVYLLPRIPTSNGQTAVSAAPEQAERKKKAGKKKEPAASESPNNAGKKKNNSGASIEQASSISSSKIRPK